MPVNAQVASLDSGDKRQLDKNHLAEVNSNKRFKENKNSHNLKNSSIVTGAVANANLNDGGIASSNGLRFKQTGLVAQAAGLLDFNTSSNQEIPP